MNQPSLYPLTFVPIIKEKVWGGSKLNTILHKQASNKAGESWEISGVDQNVSVVASGALKGVALNVLIDRYKEKFLGEKVYEQFGDQFPLLFKFIDAQEDLSVQLHPDDTIAKRRHNSFGKSEMWYVLQADSNARLILGFTEGLSKEHYSKLLERGEITDVLHSKPVASDDAFIIAPGLVHAIGAGVLLAEIQQSSDITYRIYDWDRPDIDGSLRDLHTDLALDAIDFNNTNPELHYVDKTNERVEVGSCSYFVTNKLKLTENLKLENFVPTSFKTYMCLEGSANFVTHNAKVSIKKGQTVLLPACIAHYTIETKSVSLLEVFIP